MQFELAGPREKLYFDPAKTRAGIVTCGGLCPGLNDVIRSIYLELNHAYGITEVLGFRGGYQGLDPECKLEPFVLTSEFVDDIHKEGGTVLGTSREPVDVVRVVDNLIARGIIILFTIGGDGTQRGGIALFKEAKIRGYALSLSRSNIENSAIEHDTSGNIILKDICHFMRYQIEAYFRSEQIPIIMRYFDPNYLIRSCPANAGDSILCDLYARYAVHAAMVGKTGLVIGYLHDKFIHVPVELLASQNKILDIQGLGWSAVLSATGQREQFE